MKIICNFERHLVSSSIAVFGKAKKIILEKEEKSIKFFYFIFQKLFNESFILLSRFLVPSFQHPWSMKH